MCGIFCYISPPSEGSSEDVYNTVSNAILLLKHRGPDQQGIWMDENPRLYLAHSRLSIKDLTSSGKQPMMSKCGRYILIFNGEIYNHAELREKVKRSQSIVWRGTSDTEVLLECLIYFGVENTLPLINGMFSFVYYDTVNFKLWLARDRFGEKPLYYYATEEKLIISSELRAIESVKPKLTLNSEAVDALLKFSYIPQPLSIYNEVAKFPPGHFACILLRPSLHLINPVPYWSLDGLSPSKTDAISFKDATEKAESLLTNSIKLRMDVDVPFGSFLSGGIDSSLIVSLMQKISTNPIKTFTIGFDDPNYNEAPHAKKIARHLGTEHHEIYLSPRDMISVIPSLSSIFDEPFGDSSQLPTYAVCKYAREFVTVALTGDAGDEIFCGYNRYTWAPYIYKRFNKLPKSIRLMLSKSLKALSPLSYDSIYSYLSGGNPKHKSIGDKLHKFAGAITFADEKNLYGKLIQVSQQLTNQVCTQYNPSLNKIFDNSSMSFVDKMVLSDIFGYMQHDILTKVDRASMAVSLETRIPFLDNDVVDFSISLPESTRLHHGKSKAITREILRNYIPEELFDKPKTGFGVPIYDWLRNELRDWAENLLSIDNLSKTGLLNVVAIRNLWLQHLAGKANNQYPLWNVLMLQSWLEHRGWLK